MLPLSVVIPNYNHQSFLETCLDSLAAQSLPPTEFEILVADDGSDDASAACAARWNAEHPGHALRWLPGEHTGWPGLVRNRGVALSHGRCIVCLDADDTLAPTALERLLDAARSGPMRIAVCDYMLEEEGRVWPALTPEYAPEILRTQFPCSSLMCAPRALWDRLGGYTHETVYEDWDLLVRAVAAGFVWTRVPDILFHYRVHAGGFSTTAREQDGRAKATIVLRSPHFFDPAVVWWARNIHEGQSWMPPFPRGFIPQRAHLCALRRNVRDALGSAAAEQFFPARLLEPCQTDDADGTGEGRTS